MKKYIKNVIQVAGVSLGLLLLNGCATMVGDNARTVCVDSSPRGAGIYVDGQRQGTTPATVTLPTYIYGGKTVTLKKEGYHDQTMVVNSKFQPCGLWNLLFFPGFLIDGATGNIVKIDPAQSNLVSNLQVVSPENSK